MEEISRFDWIADSAIGEAGCVTFVRTPDLAVAAWAFGGDLANAEEAELEDSFGDPDNPLALLRRVDDMVIVVENNGYEGSRPEVLRRLPGTVVSVFWNVEAVTRFTYVVDGTVVTDFEALFPESRTGSDPDAISAQMADLNWDYEEADTESVMLALAARLTGFVLAPEHLDGPMVRVALLPWPQDQPDRILPQYDPLTSSDPVLSYALQAASDADRRSAARAAVAVAADAAGMADDPAVRSVVDGTAGDPERTVLDDLARELGPREQWPRFRAVEAARAALRPDALAAAFGAVTEATYGVQAARGDGRAVRAAAMAALGDPAAPAGSASLVAGDGGRPWDPYTWIDQHWLGWAADLAFVRGPGVAVGGRPLPAGPVRLEPGLIWRLPVGGWTLVLEVGEVLRPVVPYLTTISGGGEAVHVRWSVRGQAEFHWVAGGELRAGFVAHRPDDVSGTAPSELDELRAGLTFPVAPGDGGPAPMLLALAERITGVRFTPDLLDASWEPRPRTGPA